MSLGTGRPRGNPNWKKGVVTNPGGKPKGTKDKSSIIHRVNERLKYKHKVHPVDQLVSLALEARMNKDLELAADIWLKMLQYMEPTKKPVESAPEKPTTPEQSKEAAEAALKMLEDIANDGDDRISKGSSNTPGLGTGPTDLQTEASTKDNL